MKGTMRPISVDRSGMMGQKPRPHPALAELHKEQEKAKNQATEQTPKVQKAEPIEEKEFTLETDVHECGYCGAEFDAKRKLQGHLIKHTRKSK